MTPYEFKAWFDGFTASDDGPPSLAKRSVINARIADIDGFALDEQIFLEVFSTAALNVPLRAAIVGGPARGLTFDAETAMHALGKALMFVGPDRLLWGSESFLSASVQPWVDLFATIQIPEEYQDRCGYPAITEEGRRKMFGLNQARLLGIDVAAKVAEFSPRAAYA